jgi:hypothetical protein
MYVFTYVYILPLSQLEAEKAQETLKAEEIRVAKEAGEIARLAKEAEEIAQKVVIPPFPRPFVSFLPHLSSPPRQFPSSFLIPVLVFSETELCSYCIGSSPSTLTRLAQTFSVCIFADGE